MRGLSLGLGLGLSSLAPSGAPPAPSGAFDFRTGSMPGGSTYTRTGAATGRTLAGLIQSFLADVPQQTDAGLALEPARTNLITYSQEFDNAAWTKVRLTVTADTANAPDGTTTADTINEGVVAGTHLAQASSVSVTATQTYVVSCYGQNIDGQYLNLWASTTAALYACAVFDLSTGTVASSTALGAGWSVALTYMEALAGGWYRCVMVFVSGSTGSLAAGISMTDSPTAGGSNGIRGYTGTSRTIRVWGYQAENASFASSYIATTSATATRALPVFTETVPAGKLSALLTYADASTSQHDVVDGGTFDAVTPVVGVGKGRSGSSELITRAWQSSSIASSYSQSTNYGGAGVAAISYNQMVDDTVEPFAATLSPGDQYLQATLAALTDVKSVTIRATPTGAGWGAVYLNGRLLQGTADASPGPGSTWTTITTLTGFANTPGGPAITFPAVGSYTALRIYNGGSGFIAASMFRVNK